MKKRLARIICGVLCAVLILPTAVLAAEKTDDTVPTTEETKDSGLRFDPKDKYPVYSGYTPDYSGYDSYQYQLFLDIFNLYKDTHLFSFDEDQLTEAFLMKLMRENPDLMKLFLDTLLTTMDPYSGYYEAGTGLAGDGSIGGYGIRFADETNGSIISIGRTAPGFYIAEVAKGSPAEQAGILPGDRIVSVEGIPVNGLTLEGASYLLKALPYVPKEVFDELGNSLGIPNEPEFVIVDEETGKKAYPIHIDIERNGEIIPVKMIKGRVIFSNIIYERAPDKTYSSIAISSFSGNTDVEDFAAALEKAKKESRGNLLIDLRDNLGGRVESAIAIANMLIPEKDRILCYYNSRTHTEPEAVYSDGTGYAFDKITVLVNENTASASELLAMTLSYNAGATIIGTNTFGKAVGQQGYSFMGGDMFTITSMEILDPLKRSYHNIGLTPDVEIGVCIKKYDFPKDTGTFVFTPNSRESDMSPTAELGAMLPCMTFAMGETGDNILAMEQRLAIIGIMRPEYADGVVDEHTIAAITAFEIDVSSRPEGILGEDEAKVLVSLSERYRSRWHTYDSQLEVAVMSFSSRSQAKRRAKELIRESDIERKNYEAYEKAEYDRLMREEAEEMKRLEEQEKMEQEQQNTENEAPAQAPAEDTQSQNN